jgi:hypothetical protein
MNHLKIFEYFSDLVGNVDSDKYEEDFKNELIRLTIKYSGKVPTQVMIDWLETNLEILKSKAEKEKKQ